MLPFGLQFKVFKTPKKLPMTLEKTWTEESTLHKITNTDYPKNTKRKVKGKTRKNQKP